MILTVILTAILTRAMRALPIAAALAVAMSAKSNSARANDNDAAELPSAGAMIAPDTSRLEDDIAQLEQKRDTVAPATLPWLELQIDARIFARWLFTQAAKGKEPDSDKEVGSAQIGAYLHANSMLALVPAIDDYSSKQSAGPDSVQAVGMGRIHQLTYQLKDAKDLAALDAASAEVAQDLLVAITPLQQGQRLPAMVPMRPAVASGAGTSALATGGGASGGGASGGGGGPRSVDELAAMARQASVSPGLRRQLIATATLAQQAQADPAQKDETKALRDQLASAIDLTAGLQSNTAVTTDERGQIESQLCDGLALFSDPRLRAAGRERLASLDQYRQLLGRVQKMRVPPELKDALAPALAWAHQHSDRGENGGDQGDKVLSAVEKFVALYQRQEARPPQPEQFALLRPGDALRRAYEEISKQFIKARGDFLGDAGNLGGASAPSAASASGSGAGGDGPMIDTASGPDVLSERVNEMARLENLLDVLLAMPKTLQTIDAYRPRPIGGVDRRVNGLLFTIESPLKSPAREEASKQLFDLHSLGLLATQLADRTVANVPPQVAQAYTGDQLGPLQAKWKSTVADLAASFAVNQPMDPHRLDHLRAVLGLLDALGPVADLEAAFAKADGLAKWADWTLTTDQVHALIAPYQQAMSQAFGGFVSDNPDALGAFAKLRPRYEPVIAMLIRTGSYADACAALPDGTPGLLDRLATPYEKAPFREQRFASFIASLCAAANGDEAVTQTAVQEISKHVQQ